MKKISAIIDPSFIRFIVVGIINTAFGVGLYCLFIYLGIPYRISVLLSTTLGVLFNFKTISKFVFKTKENRLIFKFIASYVIVYFLNIFLIQIFLMTDILDEYLAGIMATPIVALISYFIQRKFVFNYKKTLQ